MKINKLIANIISVDQQLKLNATQAVNQALTIRNWCIGYYIVEYEQNGEDRAEYGTALMKSIAERLNTKGLSYRNLNLFRKFFLVYPQIVQSLSALSHFNVSSIRQLATDELQNTENKQYKIGQPTTDQSDLQLSSIMQTASAQLQKQGAELVMSDVQTGSQYLLNLIQKVSFSHFVELIAIEDNVKRQFYELLILKTTPTVKELKRQISSLAYERIGLSAETDMAFKELQNKIKPTKPTDIVKSHYFLEFLNINNPKLIEESNLENALLNHLHEFILELGNGFCFEARQKRIIIGEKYYFIDLVFYHRILKCHILIELKVADFEHVNAGQLNTYINYYKKHFQEKGDNPPVGILLVTDKDKALVEYATAGMDENLFVSKYMLQLPDKTELENFIKTELKEI